MAVEISGPPVEKILEAVKNRWQTTWLSYFDASIKKFGMEYAVGELLLALQDSRKSFDPPSVAFYRYVFKAGIDFIPRMPLATAEATVSQMINISGNNNDYASLTKAASNALEQRREQEASAKARAAQADTAMSLAALIARNPPFLTDPTHYLKGYFP